jgi:DUF2934 family protein
MAKRVESAKRVSLSEDRREKLRSAPEEGTLTLEAEIRLRAYYRYLDREGAPGDAMSDWLEAESDVLSRHATGVDADDKVSDDVRR